MGIFRELCGSIMSHVNGGYGNSAIIKNCLAIGTYVSHLGTTGTFIRVGVQGDPYTIDNCYYKTSWGAVQGTQATETELSDGTTAAALGEAWAQDPGTGNPLPKVFTTLRQDKDGNYLIGSVTDWKRFADIVNSGTNTAANAKMVADVDLGDDQTMIGSGSINARDGVGNVVFKGTFDGQGHSLTINYNNSETFVAPFRFIFGATIKNIHVKGSVTGSGKWLGGIVASVVGVNIYSYLEKCYSSVSVTSTNSPSDNTEHIGGIVSQHAWESKLSLTDCIFDGTLKRKSANKTMSGLVGCSDGVLDINNCISLGTLIDESDSPNRVATFSYPWTHGSLNAVNSYYYNAFGTLQGTQATDGDISDGTTATALQAGRSEEIWVQDPVLGIPMLKIFVNTGEEVPVIDPIFISGLVQHWPFDGNANNYVSGGVNATVYGATLTTDRFGNENSAYYFDGNDKMTAAGAANFGTTSFTANIWVNSTKTSGLGNLMRTDGGYYKGWLLRFNSGRIEIWEGRSYNTGYVSSTSYADGNWHMVTFVRDVENKVGQLYVDGCYVGGYSMGSPINDVTNELRFGTYGDGEYYTGKMDDARLYNRALSAEEIAALYTQNGATIYTVPASGLGTFSAAYNIIIPEELTAYYCTKLKTNKDGSLGIKVFKLNGGIIPANTGVLLEGPASKSYTLTATNEETTAPADNSLVAVTKPTHISATKDDYTNFMMKDGKFVRIEAASYTVKMPANRAYLPLLTSAISGSNAKEIMLYWDDEEATGIERMRNVENEIMRNGNIYNLNGQKLSAPQKGINIINGRKVIVK